MNNSVQAHSGLPANLLIVRSRGVCLLCFGWLAAVAVPQRPSAQTVKPSHAIAYVGAPGELTKPIDIVVLRDYLVVLDESSYQPLVVFSRSDGRLVRRVGVRGPGGHSLISPVSLEPDLELPNALWVHDVAQAKIVRLDLSLLKRASAPVSHLRRLPPTITVFNPIPVGGFGTFTTGFLPNTRLARVDSNGRVMDAMGQPLGDEAHPISVRQEAYRSSLAVNLQKRRVLLASRHADRIDLYSFNGSLIATAARPRGFEPSYDVASGPKGPVMTSGRDLRFGYVDVSTTPHKIVALYSGLSRAEAKGTAQLGREIHTMDWDGRGFRRIYLPKPALAVSVSPNDKHVYALHLSPSPSVAVYHVQP